MGKEILPGDERYKPYVKPETFDSHNDTRELELPAEEDDYIENVEHYYVLEKLDTSDTTDYKLLFEAESEEDLSLLLKPFTEDDIKNLKIVVGEEIKVTRETHLNIE